jgi:mRNA-degrading endonuclease RelE of RelBE toxin-antitoxin system
MRIEVVVASKSDGPFERALRALEKTWPHVRQDVQHTFDQLARDKAPVPLGTRIVLLMGVRPLAIKARVASSDMKRGKSGGFRVLLYQVGKDQWRAFFIYAKSEQEDVRVAARPQQHLRGLRS